MVARMTVSSTSALRRAASPGVTVAIASSFSLTAALIAWTFLWNSLSASVLPSTTTWVRCASVAVGATLASSSSIFDW